MAKAATIKFSEYKLELGDGGNPEVFAQPCGARTRGWNRTINYQESPVPHCDDEDAAAEVELDAVDERSEMTFAGTVDDADFDTWLDWYESYGDTKNVRVTLKLRTWIVPCKIANLNLTGERGGKAMFTAQLRSTGRAVRQ